MKCPKCRAVMELHGLPTKGIYHCNSCGAEILTRSFGGGTGQAPVIPDDVADPPEMVTPVVKSGKAVMVPGQAPESGERARILREIDKMLTDFKAGYGGSAIDAELIEEATTLIESDAEREAAMRELVGADRKYDDTNVTAVIRAERGRVRQTALTRAEALLPKEK